MRSSSSKRRSKTGLKMNSALILKNRKIIIQEAHRIINLDRSNATEEQAQGIKETHNEALRKFADLVLHDVGDVKGTSSATSSKENKLIEDAFARTNVGEYENINPEYGESMKTFHVSVKLLRRRKPAKSSDDSDNVEEFRIGDVSFSEGRPATNYQDEEGNQITAQGNHVVAYALLLRAISNQLKGKTFAEAAPILRTILEFELGKDTRNPKRRKKEIDKKSIGKKLDLLEERSKLTVLFKLDQFDFDGDRFRIRIRQHIAIMMSDLNIAIENIIRLWNKRKHVVYHQKKIGDVFWKDIFGSGIDNREKTAFDKLEKMSEENNGKENNGKENNPNFHIAYLIDIKHEEDAEINGKDYVSIHKEIYIAAVTEATRLAKLAFVALEADISVEKVKDGIKKVAEEEAKKAEEKKRNPKKRRREDSKNGI